LRRPPEFRFPKSRDRGWWFAIAASLGVHLVLLSVKAADWFWADGTPPEVQYVQLTPDLAQVDMNYRAPLPPRRKEQQAQQQVPVPAVLDIPAPRAPEVVASEERPGIPQASLDTGGAAVDIPTGESPRGIPRLRPFIGEGKLWVAPLPFAPKELAQRLSRSHFELVDSAVTEIVQHYIDSMLTAPVPFDTKPPSWTTKIAGKTFGIDQNYIYFGGLKIPSAILALLPLPTMSNVDLRNSQRLADIRADLNYAAARSQNMEDFKKAIRELRQRREREEEFQRNLKKAPADTVVP
jgi:hypothetical protein